MDSELKQRIQGMIDSQRVVLFMKGNKMFPQCGFSARVVQILKAAGADFKDVNVLTDPSVREGIKQFSDSTAEDLTKEMSKLHNAGMKSVVLDLRSEPRGPLATLFEDRRQLCLARGGRGGLLARDSESLSLLLDLGSERFGLRLRVVDPGAEPVDRLLRPGPRDRDRQADPHDEDEQGARGQPRPPDVAVSDHDDAHAWREERHA